MIHLRVYRHTVLISSFPIPPTIMGSSISVSCSDKE